VTFCYGLVFTPNLYVDIMRRRSPAVLASPFFPPKLGKKRQPLRANRF
jgi:hypothetical protein